ncbi:hypothetical protein ANO11243_068100 [Dothideomycetidae sp. 11243]|nr:hypothetical protein ANO11243_068100 [fungal sp. No.11243]
MYFCTSHAHVAVQCSHACLDLTIPPSALTATPFIAPSYSVAYGSRAPLTHDPLFVLVNLSLSLFLAVLATSAIHDSASVHDGAYAITALDHPDKYAAKRAVASHRSQLQRMTAPPAPRLFSSKRSEPCGIEFPLRSSTTSLALTHPSSITATSLPPSRLQYLSRPRPHGTRTNACVALRSLLCLTTPSRLFSRIEGHHSVPRAHSQQEQDRVDSVVPAASCRNWPLKGHTHRRFGNESVPLLPRDDAGRRLHFPMQCGFMSVAWQWCREG